MGTRRLLSGAAVVASGAGILLAGFACDDESDTTPGTTAGTTSGTPAGSTGGTGGTGGTATGGTGGNATGGSGGAATTEEGEVTAVNFGATYSSVSARFGSANPANCTRNIVGACVVHACDLGGGGAGGGATVPHAGDITLTGGLRDVTMTPGADGFYTEDLAAAALFDSNDTIAFAAAGDTIPSFAQSVSVPAHMTWTTPDLSGASINVDTTADLSVAWTGGVSDAVLVIIGGITPDVDVVSAVCTYDATAGTGTIPSAGLLDQMLQYGDGTINAIAAEVETVTAGDYGVTLTLGDNVEGTDVTFTN